MDILRMREPLGTTAQVVALSIPSGVVRRARREGDLERKFVGDVP